MHAEVVWTGALCKQFQQREQRAAPPKSKFHDPEPGLRELAHLMRPHRYASARRNDKAVLDALAILEPQTTRELVEHCQVSLFGMQEALQRLQQVGQVERVGLAPRSSTFSKKQAWLYARVRSSGG